MITSDNFRREAKKLLKKYASLQGELEALGEELLANPQIGTPLGLDAYKTRLAVKSKGKGKSGGLRVITYIEIVAQIDAEADTNVVLLSIYDKSEYETIEEAHLKRLIQEVREAGESQNS